MARRRAGGAAPSARWCADPRCARQLTAADGAARLCASSLGFLVADLRGVYVRRRSARGEVLPTLAEEVAATAHKLARLGHVDIGVRAASADGVSLPFNERASDALAALRNALSTSIRLLWEENKPARVPLCLFRGRPGEQLVPLLSAFVDELVCDDTVEAMAEWLALRPSWLAEHAAAGELQEELGSAIAECWRVIDRPADLWYAGPCGEDGCEGEVYGHPESAVARCRICGLTWGMTERRDWLLHCAERVELTAAELSKALPGLLERPLSPETIRTWYRAGRIVPASWTDRGWPRFRVGPVVDVALETPTRVRRGSVTPQGVVDAEGSVSASLRA